MNSRIRYAVAALLSACACLFPMSVLGQGGKTVMRVADSLPVGHVFADFGVKYWMDAVTKRTNGAITFEYFPSEQLGKVTDMLSLTQSGVIDVGYVVPSYIPDKMVLSAVAELPGGFQTSCQGTTAYWKVATEGVLASKEFAANKIVPMFAWVVPPYQVFSVKRRISTIAALDGMKLRTSGTAQDLTVRKLKAVPVRMTGPEIYESLTRGTMDGLIWPFLSVIPYKTERIIKFATTGQNFGSFVGTYAMSEENWNRLSPETRKVIREVGNETTKYLCEKLDRDELPTIDKLKQAGMEMITWSPEDQQKINELVSGVANDWANSLDKRGMPGTAALMEFSAAAKAAAPK